MTNHIKKANKVPGLIIKAVLVFSLVGGNVAFADEAADRRTEKAVNRYTEKAEKYLGKEDYYNARRYAYKAREKDPQNSNTAALITDINKEEMFGKVAAQDEAIKVKGEKAAQKADAAGDPFSTYNEGKGWTEHIAGLFKRKTFDLGEIREEKVYTIDECVQIALIRSQRMIMAEKQITLANMRTWEARRDLFPEVSLKIERGFGAIATGSPPRSRHYQGEKYQAEIKHTAFDGMGTWYAVRQAQVNKEVVGLERDKIKNEIIEDTKEAYYSLDKTIKAIEIQNRFIAKVNEFYEMSEKAFQRELIAKAEQLKVKSQKLEADFQYISAEEDLSLAEMILFQAMNMEPNQRIKIKPVESPKEILAIGLENCYRLALANRPELLIKDKMIEYYSFERKMAKAKAWPRIELQGSFGQAFENYQPLDTGSDITGSPPLSHKTLEPEWFGGVKGSIPLWGNTFEYNYVREKWASTVSSFRGTESATSYFTLNILDDLAYFSNLMDSRAGFERAKYEYLKQKKDLLVEVKEKYFSYRKATLQREVAETHLEQKKMSLDVMEERRRFGELEISRIIEEHLGHSISEFAIIEGDADYYIAITELNKTIGLPEYFKPGYEREEYKLWLEKQDSNQAAKNRTATSRAAAKAKTSSESSGGILNSIFKSKESKSNAQKQAERIAAYLDKSRTQLAKGKFNSARGYARKAYKLDPENKETLQLLSEIDTVEESQK